MMIQTKQATLETGVNINIVKLDGELSMQSVLEPSNTGRSMTLLVVEDSREMHPGCFREIRPAIGKAFHDCNLLPCDMESYSLRSHNSRTESTMSFYSLR